MVFCYNKVKPRFSLIWYSLEVYKKKKNSLKNRNFGTDIKTI